MTINRALSAFHFLSALFFAATFFTSHFLGHHAFGTIMFIYFTTFFIMGLKKISDNYLVGMIDFSFVMVKVYLDQTGK